uniref:Bifunctional NAD(P)H-hydrate repair enzyme n=2 Tax=Methanomicrobia TaxID=224756 RepID=A0A7H1KPB3_9EURY|nr:ATP-dependent (S)-NAD(P)H-hydrate dehydratase [Methanosarcinales archaeon ANME-1 ERB7]QNT35777.1 ATP-dependent (S)-NAD(P)H-hydrate dehydratase [uncultured Methanosarcinales archaeon]
MIRHITSEAMAALDENCKFYGLIPLQLMENAGANVANEVKKRFTGEGTSVTVVAGKGNNGGDAFTAARHLHGFDVKIVLIGRSKDLRTEETSRNMRILKENGFDIAEITDSSELKTLYESEVIIDAIFGTGISGKIREPEATAIDLINDANAFVVAVDVPSGLDPGTGEAEKAVHADLTVTFHSAKRGLLNAKEYVGELVVADIGIPDGMERLAGPGDVRIVAKRKASSHKGDNGRVLIVGGGPFFGAPTLAALAALHAGADWVTIAAPKSVSSIIASISPNLIVQPLSSEILVEKDVPVVSNLIKRHDVVVIGMGLGAEEATKKAVRMIIEATKNVVVDADGLYGLQLPLKDKHVIMTPHAGEISKIRGMEGRIEVPPEANSEERIELIKEVSKLNKVVTLMKGPTDIISDGVRVKLTRKGNVGMTVGGTGDVLAGITGAFFAIASDPFKAATAAAFVNSTAGDLAFADKGYGLLATDVVENIPRVMKDFE